MKSEVITMIKHLAPTTWAVHVIVLTSSQQLMTDDVVYRNMLPTSYICNADKELSTESCLSIVHFLYRVIKTKNEMV